MLRMLSGAIPSTLALALALYVVCVTYFRVIQQSFIDMENMFDLMKEEQEASDALGLLLIVTVNYCTLIIQKQFTEI